MKGERDMVFASYYVLAAGFVLSQVQGIFRLVAGHKLNREKK